MRYVIDLDHTICFPNDQFKDTKRRYSQAKPNPKVIAQIQKLYLNGDYIIIHTARRMVTHKGNIAKIEADVGEVTRTWLRLHTVQYHELVFGKPYGDVYIDDKGMSIDEFVAKY
jgi:capsule biosynthesis phosphatase